MVPAAVQRSPPQGQHRPMAAGELWLDWRTKQKRWLCCGHGPVRVHSARACALASVSVAWDARRVALRATQRHAGRLAVTTAPCRDDHTRDP